MRQDYFSKNVNQIKSIAASNDSYNLNDLKGLLINLKEKGLVSNSMPSSKFYDRLVDIGLLSFSVFMDGGYLTRYSFNESLSNEKLLTSLKKNAFLSMSSALNYIGLSEYRNNFIFISKEQTDKGSDSGDVELTQKAIDNAFAKDYRKTHMIGKYNNKHIIFLQPKYTMQFGVTEIDGIKVSSVNRALVEMVVNVQYFRNSREIIDVFSKIKNHINVDEVFAITQRFDFIYPYFQSIGYILEEIGFEKRELDEFKECISEFDFYTDKNQLNYSYDPYWKMYHI